MSFEDFKNKFHQKMCWAGGLCVSYSDKVVSKTKNPLIHQHIMSSSYRYGYIRNLLFTNPHIDFAMYGQILEDNKYCMNTRVINFEDYSIERRVAIADALILSGSSIDFTINDESIPDVFKYVSPDAFREYVLSGEASISPKGFNHVTDEQRKIMLELVSTKFKNQKELISIMLLNEKFTNEELAPFSDISKYSFYLMQSYAKHLDVNFGKMIAMRSSIIEHVFAIHSEAVEIVGPYIVDAYRSFVKDEKLLLQGSLARLYGKYPNSIYQLNFSERALIFCALMEQGAFTKKGREFGLEARYAILDLLNDKSMFEEFDQEAFDGLPNSWKLELVWGAYPKLITRAVNFLNGWK